MVCFLLIVTLCLNSTQTQSQFDSEQLHQLTDAQWRHQGFRASDSEVLSSYFIVTREAKDIFIF